MIAMAEWKKVTYCPKCGGKLTISEHYAYSLDFSITKKGVLSKKFKKSDGGPVDCITAYCDECNSYWDGSQTIVEHDNTVYLKMMGSDS